MAKLKNGSIHAADMLEYLDAYSDFSFELAVLKMLRGHEIDCEHGGYYEDPVTKKAREFDIRATRKIENFRVRLSIECKNVREHFPVLVSCVPRQKQESYHQIISASDPAPGGSNPLDMPHLYRSRVRVYSFVGEHSLYREKEPVGKSTVQVGRALDGSVSASDGELYEKWGQCLSSLDGHVASAYWDGDSDDDEPGPCTSAAFPFVVIPNGRLWEVLYDNSGNRVSPPTQVDRISCFIGKDYQLGTNMVSRKLWISHLEIVTFDGLQSFVEQFLASKDGMTRIFSKDGILDALNRLADRNS